MSTTTYISKFSGTEIDRAVAYFNSTEAAGRQVVTYSVNISDWVTDPSDIAKYTLTIGLSGTFDPVPDYPPLVYFLDSNGLKWDLDYKWFVPSGESDHRIKCYSNTPVGGDIIILGMLSDLRQPAENATASSEQTEQEP